MNYVVAKCPGLSFNAYKVLMRMASMALDEPSENTDANCYFGGWGPLAIAIGLGESKKGKDAVTTAIAELRWHGLVDPVREKAHAGVRQEYYLNFTAGRNTVDRRAASEYAQHKKTKKGPTGGGPSESRDDVANPRETVANEPATVAPPLHNGAERAPEIGVQWAPTNGVQVGPRDGGKWAPADGAPTTRDYHSHSKIDESHLALATERTERAGAHDEATRDSFAALREQQIINGCHDWKAMHFYERKQRGSAVCKCGSNKSHAIHFDSHYDFRETA